MAEESGLRLFGFEIKRTKTSSEVKQLPSIVPPVDDDGAGYITASGSHYGQYLNLDGDESKDNHQLIIKYRGVAMHPEVDAAVEDIVNESISIANDGSTVTVNMDNVEVSDKIKKNIQEEFKNTKTSFTIFRPPILYGINAPGNIRKLIKLVDTKLPLPFKNFVLPVS